MFHNAVEFAVLYPGEDASRWAFCAPRLDDDPKVEAVWRRLALRAGITVATGPLQGWLDTAEAGLVRGWARDAANSDMPVPVEVVVDGVVLGSTLANRYRDDLATAAMATAGTASNSVFPRHSPLTGRLCSLPGAQPIAPRSPAAATVAERRSPSPRCSLSRLIAQQGMTATGHGPSSPLTETKVGNGSTPAVRGKKTLRCGVKTL
jgi:O-antigen biosynthesis protein